jgi:hypothetical protein
VRCSIRSATPIYGHRVDAAQLRASQQAPVPLTLDHEQVAGEVLTLTRVRGGGVYAVAVARDSCDPLLEVDEPIYFSSTTGARASDGGDGVLLDFALTLATARVAARLVELLVGDVRSSIAHGRWWLRGLTADLVDGLVDELRHQPKDAPIHVRDLEHQKWLRRENERRARSLAPLDLKPRPGMPVPPQMRANWRPGMIEWSQVPGRVLDVR